jgi:hypothetical protein
MTEYYPKYALSDLTSDGDTNNYVGAYDSEFILGGEDSTKDLIKKAKLEAAKVISKERHKYAHIFSAIIKYIESNPDIFISDIDICANQELSVEDTVKPSFTLYCNNTFKHAKNLTNEIYLAGSRYNITSKDNSLGDKYYKLIQMRTIMEKEEFWIDYGVIQIVHLLSISPYKSDSNKSIITNYAKAVLPFTIGKLRYLPSEIEIINVYDNLTNYKELSTNLVYEEKLLKSSIDKYESICKVGGTINTGQSCQDKKRDLIETIKIAIILKLLPNHKDIILVGSWAYNLFKLGIDDICANLDRIQIISYHSSEYINNLITKFIKDELVIGNMSIDKSEAYSLNLAKEFRITRTIFTANISAGVKDKPFLELYDSTLYNLYPCIKLHGITVGHKYVMLKYLFIDIWTANILLKFGNLENDKYKSKIGKTISIIKNTHEFMINNPELVIGRYEEPDITKKRMIKEKKTERKAISGWFFPYIPYVYLKNNNKLQYV